MLSLGGYTSSDNIRVRDSSIFYGLVHGSHNLHVTNNSIFHGSAVLPTLSMNNSTFAADEGTLNKTLFDPTEFEVMTSWPAP